MLDVFLQIMMWARIFQHCGSSNRRLLGHVPLSILNLHPEVDEAVNLISSRAQSNGQGTKTMYTQQQRKYSEEHSGSPDPNEREPQVSLNPSVMPGQLQMIETGQIEANSFTPSEYSRGQQTQPRSREQSFVRVAAEN
jgi:hypothetical protein